MEDIVIKKLCKSFGEKEVLTDFSAVIPEGKITGLMAPSGGGKTTLLRILMGFEKPDSGTISGLPGLRLGAVFQEDRLCENLGPAANILLINPAVGKAAAEQALDRVGLSGCLDQPVREFSGGMKRRVALLRALLSEYDLLLLDEPFKGLDKDTKELVMTDTLTRCRGRTVLLVTHDPGELDCLHVVNRLYIRGIAD